MKNKTFTIAKSVFSGSWNQYLMYTLIALFAMYSFFIARTVIAINDRKDLRAETRLSQSAVSELEIRYFNLASGIDMNRASELGFVDSQTPSFAYTNPTAETAVALR